MGTILMLLGNILGSVFTGATNIAGSIIGFKTEQAKTVQKAIDAVAGLDNNDAQSTAALANALQVILTQGSFLERNWRSWLMVLLMIIIFASFFGYVPAHFNDPMTPMMEKSFELLQIGLSGYIIRRGIVDVVRMFNIGSILKALIAKKVL